jgi:hypothetical protein
MNIESPPINAIIPIERLGLVYIKREDGRRVSDLMARVWHKRATTVASRCHREVSHPKIFDFGLCIENTN